MIKQVRETADIDIEDMSAEDIIEKLKPLVALGATEYATSDYDIIRFEYSRDETEKEKEWRIRSGKAEFERGKESRQRMYEKLKKEFEG